MRFVRVVATAGLFFVLTPPASAGTEQVRIPGHFFQPARVTIHVGDSVRWTDDINERHSVTATTQASTAGASFDSSPNCSAGFQLFSDCLRRGQSFTFTFDHPGTFVYYCKIHGSDAPSNCGMCGRVVVLRRSSGGTITPTTPGSASPTASASASRSPSASGSPSATGTGPTGSGLAGGPSSGAGSSGPSSIAIAALAVALLAGSGFLVYRTMIRR